MSFLGLEKFRKPPRHQLLSLAGHIALGMAVMALGFGLNPDADWRLACIMAATLGPAYGLLREGVHFYRTGSLNLIDRCRDAAEVTVGAFIAVGGYCGVRPLL